MLQVKGLILILFLIFLSFSLCCIEEDSDLEISTPAETAIETPAATLQLTPTPSLNLTAIVDKVEEVRGLNLIADIPQREISREELEERYNTTEKASDDPDDILLKALFMVEWDDDLEGVEASYKSSTVMAYYDIENKEMVIVSGYEAELEKIYAHEYTHVLQDQHFNLTEILNQSTFDGRMARDALVEGDALLTCDLYQGKTPSGLAMGVSKVYEDVTRRTLEAFRTFSHTRGKFFVTQLYNEGGGWELVNEAYRNPPRTTEMIMHPDKYTKGEEGVNMSAPDLLLDGWNMTINDTMGELFIRTMLADHIKSSNASTSASGWGGDRLVLYQNETDYLFCFNISWDSPMDADEFLEGYRELMRSVNGTKIVDENDSVEWVVDENEWVLLLEINDSLNRTVLAGSSNPGVLNERMEVLVNGAC
ncbi:MAG: hypothetical protein ACXQS6_05440 [Candidatus Syntropharchaeales archaeon]